MKLSTVTLKARGEVRRVTQHHALATRTYAIKRVLKTIGFVRSREETPDRNQPTRPRSSLTHLCKSHAALAMLAVAASGFLPAPGSAQGAADYALSFDGVEDFVLVPSHSLLELTDGTLELWFRPDWAPGTIAYDPVLIANRQADGLTRYSLQLDRSLAGVMLANGSSVSSVPYSFNRGQWYHLALSESGSTAQAYVNGRFIGSTTNGFGTLIGLPTQLGSGGAGAFFHGLMDEVRIWNIARNATDIRHDLSRALSGSEPGLVGYWRMNEGMGPTLIDATANRLDGTVFGPVWTRSDVVLVNTTGSFGTALNLTASRNTSVEVASAPSLALSNQFSFEAWIKPRSAQCGTVLSRGDGVNLANTDYIFQIGTDGSNCGVARIALMAAGEWAVSESAVPLGAWTHVAVTYDGTNQQFYLNGLLDRSVAGTGSLHQSTSPLFIGRQGSICNCNFFDGALDEVRLWNTARNAAQIQTNLNLILPAATPGLVGYWRFNEQSGIRAADASGRGNHGVWINRPSPAISFWAPAVTINGADPSVLECHDAYADAGATVAGSPAALAANNHGYFNLALTADGRVTGWGNNFTGTINVPANATNVIALAPGAAHSLALRSDGTVVGWGDNSFGQITIPVSATDVVALAAGEHHSLALKADGSVLAWGSNAYGETSVPPSATNVVALAAGGNFSVALKADGKLIGWGENGNGQITIPTAATNVVAIAAGYFHTLALKADGNVLAWGFNNTGQTTIPANAFNVVALAAGYGHSLALRADGRAVGWGYGDYGQTIAPAGATNVVAITAGSYHSLALKADGSVLGWGDNSSDQTRFPSSLTNGYLSLTARGAANPDLLGNYLLTYSAASAAGGVGSITRAVIVTDTKPPILTLAGGNPLNLDGRPPFVDPGASANDACEGSLTGSIVRTGNVNSSVPGVYQLTYTVADSSGNSATANRTVAVRDKPSVSGSTAFIAGTNTITGLPTAQLLADVNPNGLASIAFFQYGLSTADPGRSAPVNLPAAYTISTFLRTTEGLMPGATYHYRVMASNSLGVAYGPDQIFTVLAPAPGDVNRDGRVDQGELDAVLSNYWAYSPWLAMTNPTPLGRGFFQFGLTNAGGWNFSVLATTNLDSPLTDWSNIGSAWPVWQFHDPAGTNQGQRFYRLRWP